MRPRRGDRGFGYLLVAPAVFVILLIGLFPLYQLAVTSFQNITMFAEDKSFAGLVHYARLFEDARLWESLLHTVAFAAVALPIELLLGFALALLFLERMPLRRTLIAIILLPCVISPIVAGATWRLMFDQRFGPVNQVLGWLAGGDVKLLWTIDPQLVWSAILVAEVWQWTPFMFLLLLAGLANVDREQLESAEVDGASWWLRLRRVSYCRRSLPVMAIALLIRGTRSGAAVRRRLDDDPGWPRHHDRDGLDLRLPDGVSRVRGELLGRHRAARGGWPHGAGAARAAPRGTQSVTRAVGAGRGWRLWARFAAALLIAAAFFFPVYWLAAISVKTPEEIFASPPVWLPSEPQFGNYLTLFRDGDAWSVWNSLVTAGVSTVFAMLLGTLAAYAIVRYRTGGQHLALWIISQRMVPPICIAFPVFLLFVAWRWVDTYIGLIVLYTAFNLPYVVWMMRGYLQEIPLELEHSALVDGLSRVGVLRKVVLPMARGGLFATAVFTFIFAWNDFLFALILTRSEVVITTRCRSRVTSVHSPRSGRRSAR